MKYVYMWHLLRTYRGLRVLNNKTLKRKFLCSLHDKCPAQSGIPNLISLFPSSLQSPRSPLTSSYPPSLPLLPMPGCGRIIVCVLIHECSEDIPSRIPCGSPPSAPPPPAPRSPILPPPGPANPIPFLPCARHYKVGNVGDIFERDN